MENPKNRNRLINSDEFINGAIRTESPAVETFLTARQFRLLHASMGCCTEAGELADQLKKHLFYGASIDKVNLIEEAGDLLWYLAVLFNELGTSFEEVMSINNSKLRSRYPEKYTEHHAKTRDVAQERETLETWVISDE